MPFRPDGLEPPPPIKKEPKRTTAQFFLRNQDSKVQFYDNPVAGVGVAVNVNSDNPLQLFVALVTVRLFKDCNAIKGRTRDQWVAHSKRLIDQTMVGLVLTDGFCPENKNVRSMSSSMVKQLRKEFCTKKQLDALLMMEHPSVDATIVQCMQTHIRELSADLAKGISSRRTFWKRLLAVLAVLGAVGIGVGVGLAKLFGLF